MMPFRRICLVAPLCLVLGLPVTLCGQKSPDQLKEMKPEELGMVKVLLAQERAWNAGDIDGFMASYKNSPDTLFLGANSVTRGWAQVSQHYHESYPNKVTMGMLSFSNLEPHALDATHGYMTGSFHLERSRKAGGNADGVFSLIFEKTSEGWKIIVDHTT